MATTSTTMMTTEKTKIMGRQRRTTSFITKSLLLIACLSVLTTPSWCSRYGATRIILPCVDAFMTVTTLSTTTTGFAAHRRQNKDNNKKKIKMNPAIISHASVSRSRSQSSRACLSLALYGSNSINIDINNEEENGNENRHNSDGRTTMTTTRATATKTDMFAGQTTAAATPLPGTTTTTTTTIMTTTRRSVLLSSTAAFLLSSSFFFLPNNVKDAAYARTPGSNDVVASLQQIKDASQSLQRLLDNWSDVASIDEEGRARSTDQARRTLGGIAPQAGTAAIDAAKNTPLYRIDVAFVSVRKAVLLLQDEGGDSSWTSKVDLEKFAELADRITYSVGKADGNFYSVLFAMKGTTMINDIFKETKQLVEQTILDLDTMIGLLKDAGAPI